ncbi:MAG: hypothetical protein GF405_05215 [Candidatus Eisenbacteria bacterium]|nr:hypothetical protein [Candidatus Eisenbacteria bacterium]
MSTAIRRPVPRASVVVVLALLPALAASATVHHVPGDAATIQAGINLASEGDTVLVAPGTYSGTGNEYIDFGGTNLVLMSSGGPDVTTLNPGSSDTCFFLHSGEDTTAVIEGFTIRTAGCAFALTDAGPKLLDCSTESCGKVLWSVRSGAVIVECRFTGLWGPNYQGLEFEGLPGVTIRDCSFTEVWGAIELYETSLVLWGGEFYQTGAFKKGAAVAGWESDVEIHDAVVEECSPGAAFTNIGVALYFEACSGLVDDCVLTRNGYGGGHNNWGTATLDFDWWPLTSEFEFRNTVFYDNEPMSPTFPGAIHSNARVLVVNGCTIASDNGIGVALGDSARIENTLVAFNYHGIMSDIGDALTVTHSCVYGNTQGDSIPGTHSENLFVDPLFCDLPNGDVSLDDDSPCLPANNVWGVQIGARGVGCITDVPEEPVTRFHLHRAAPNPSAGPFRLAFDVPVAGREVEIVIYNAAGRMVRTLSTIPGAPGRHTLTWDGRATGGQKAAAGGYFVRARCGGEVSRTTLLLVR